MRGAHPGMRMHHPGAQARPQGTVEPSSSKSIVTLALPMYTVGIGVFFIYTCCKVNRIDKIFISLSLSLSPFSIGRRKIPMRKRTKKRHDGSMPMEKSIMIYLKRIVKKKEIKKSCMRVRERRFSKE